MNTPFPNNEYPHNEKLAAVYRKLTLSYWRQEIKQQQQNAEEVVAEIVVFSDQKTKP